MKGNNSEINFHLKSCSCLQSVMLLQVVLCAASPYFAELLSATGPGDHPVIILNDVSFSVISLIVEFIYTGTINIPSSMVDTVNNVAEVLNITGIVSKNMKQVLSFTYIFYISTS